MEQIKLKTDDNIKIAANYYQKGHNRIIIIAPGWCMTKDSNAFCQIAENFTDKFDVLSIDFRGHGKSGGFFTFTQKEYLDIKACVDFLRPQYKEIFLMGFSLGAASVLIYEGCAKDKGFSPVDKIIAVSPPAEFDKIENQMWKKEAWMETFKKTFGKTNNDKKGKWELNRFFTIRPSIAGLILSKKIKPIDIINKISAPTLFIAGKKDPTVHFWHTAKLFEYAKCKKHFKLFEEGIHAEDIFLYFREEFKTLCYEWLE